MVQRLRNYIQFNILAFWPSFFVDNVNLSPPTASNAVTDSVNYISAHGIPTDVLPPITDMPGKIPFKSRFNRSIAPKFDERFVGYDKLVVEKQERIGYSIEAFLGRLYRFPKRNFFLQVSQIYQLG